MNICELIERCGGPEAVGLQFIDTCATDLNWSAKSRVTRIKFATEQRLTPHGTEKMGILIWLPRDAVNAAFAAIERGEHKEQSA